MPGTKLIRDHHLWTRDTIKNVSGDVTLDISADVIIKPAGGNVYIHDGSNNIFNFDAANTFMRIYDDDDTADHFTTTVSSGGGVIMQATHGSSLPAGSYIKLVADDHVRVTSDFYIDATKKLYLDEGGDTYIHETSGDKLEVVVGGDVMARLTENGLDGNYFSFRLASAGFGALSCVAGASPILGAGGTVTDIDFRGTNKAFIADTDTAISQMNLIFPPMDANFVLVLRYSGDFSVAAWVAHEYDESVATGSASGNVLWPGGTLPDNTSGGFDVFSFFWDSNAQRCYGVASLAFDVP